MDIEERLISILDGLELEANAKLVLTDSGGVQEETSILKVPCVTLRDNTERPETLEVGSNVLVGVNRTFILDGVKSQLSKERNWQNPFGDGNAGSMIVKLLMQPQTLDQLSEETQEVFRAIADLGTGSQTSLSKAIGKPPSTIEYHLNTLKQAGLLVTKGKPPTTRYYIKINEDIGELKKYPLIKLVALLNFICINRKAFRYAGYILWDIRQSCNINEGAMMTANCTGIRVIVHGATKRSSRRARTVSWNYCGGDGNDVRG